MNAKKCPYCLALSYSAYTGTNWICPKCGKDITEVDFLKQANSAEQKEN